MIKRICKKIEITRTIYLHSEVGTIFEMKCYSWWFLRSNVLGQFKSEKIIGIKKPTGKVRKYIYIFRTKKPSQLIEKIVLPNKTLKLFAPPLCNAI